MISVGVTVVNLVVNGFVPTIVYGYVVPAELKLLLQWVIVLLVG